MWLSLFVVCAALASSAVLPVDLSVRLPLPAPASKPKPSPRPKRRTTLRKPKAAPKTNGTLAPTAKAAAESKPSEPARPSARFSPLDSKPSPLRLILTTSEKEPAKKTDAAPVKGKPKASLERADEPKAALAAAKAPKQAALPAAGKGEPARLAPSPRPDQPSLGAPKAARPERAADGQRAAKAERAGSAKNSGGGGGGGGGGGKSSKGAGSPKGGGKSAEKERSQGDDKPSKRGGGFVAAPAAKHAPLKTEDEEEEAAKTPRLRAVAGSPPAVQLVVEGESRRLPAPAPASAAELYWRDGYWWKPNAAAPERVAILLGEAFYDYSVIPGGVRLRQVTARPSRVFDPMNEELYVAADGKNLIHIAGFQRDAYLFKDAGAPRVDRYIGRRVSDVRFEGNAVLWKEDGRDKRAPL